MPQDYYSNYAYRNGAIERIMMGSGFLQDSVYYVQVKDYQGNVRAVLDQEHNLVERNDYYPYGGLINASDSQRQRLATPATRNSSDCFTINIGNINWER